MLFFDVMKLEFVKSWVYEGWFFLLFERENEVNYDIYKFILIYNILRS